MMRVGMRSLSMFFLSLMLFVQSDVHCADVIPVASFRGDAFQLFDEYLKLPEFIKEKDKYQDAGGRYIYNEHLNNGYQKAVISTQDYIQLLDAFLATYAGKPQAPHVQKLAIPAGSQVRFMGDLHGSIHALVRMLCALIAEGFLDANLQVTRPNNYLVFLGDLVDYGEYGADTLAMVMRLRVNNPNNVFVCRGNHEDAHMNKEHHNGFEDELKARYSTWSADGLVALKAANRGLGDTELDALEANYNASTSAALESLKAKINKAFDCLPLAIFLAIQDRQSEGFVQCCHGGLETSEENKVVIKRLLEKVEANGTEEITAVFGDSTQLPNLSWGDVTGKELGAAGYDLVVGRGTRYDIAGAKAEMLKFNIKYIFRGHQDSQYACKNILKGIEAPMCLVPVELGHQALLNPYRTWINNHAPSLEQLRAKGFVLKDLHVDIGPVFTFTNASSTRTNYDEGFGMLSVGEVWEDSTLRYHIERPQLFTLRAALLDTKNSPQQYLPEELNQEFEGCDAESVIGGGIQMALFLPHVTYIDENGKATVGLDKSYEDKIYGNRTLRNFRNDRFMEYMEIYLDENDENYESQRNDESQTALLHAWFDRLINRYVLPAGKVLGISQAFKDKIRSASMVKQAKAKITQAVRNWKKRKAEMALSDGSTTNSSDDGLSDRGVTPIAGMEVEVSN